MKQEAANIALKGKTYTRVGSRPGWRGWRFLSPKGGQGRGRRGGHPLRARRCKRNRGVYNAGRSDASRQPGPWRAKSPSRGRRIRMGDGAAASSKVGRYRGGVIPIVVGSGLSGILRVAVRVALRWIEEASISLSSP